MRKALDPRLEGSGASPVRTKLAQSSLERMERTTDARNAHILLLSACPNNNARHPFGSVLLNT